MTRAIFGRSSSVFASRSIIEAMIRISYGVRPRRWPLASMSSWPATRSICADHPAEHVAGDLAVGHLVRVGEQRALERRDAGRAQRRARATGRPPRPSTSRGGHRRHVAVEPRGDLLRRVKPSGNVTLVYVSLGGVRSRASTLPMWSLVRSS